MAEEDIYVSIKAEEAGLRALQGMQSVLVNLVNQIDSQANAARSSARAQADLNKAFGYGSDGARVYAKSLSEVRRNSAVVNQYLQQNNNQLKVLQRTFVGAGKSADSFSKQTIANLARIQKQASQIRLTQQIQDFRSMSRAVLNVGKNMQYVGRNLTIGLTFPIVSFLRFGLESFKKLEQEIIRFEKISNLDRSSEAFERLSKQLDDITDKYGLARELAQGVAADFATLGLETSVIGDLVQMTAEVEKLGDVTIEESRLFIQSMYFQTLSVQRAKQGTVDYGLAIEQVAGQLAMFNAIENNTVVTMQDAAKVIPEMSAAATEFGLTMSEAIAVFAPMKAAGFQVGAAGNSIKVSLQRLVKPAKMNKAVLEELRAELGDFTFEVGVGIDAISNLASSFGALKESKGAQGALELFARLFGVRQGSRMLAAIRELSYFQEQLQDTTTESYRAANAIVDSINQSLSAAGIATTFQANTISDLSEVARKTADAYAEGNMTFVDAVEEGRRVGLEQLGLTIQEFGKLVDSQAGRVLLLQLAGEGAAEDIYTDELAKALETPAVKLAIAREQFKKISRELTPPLIDALTSLTPHVKRFAEFIASLSATTIRNIALMFGLAAAVGPVITAFSNLLQTAGFLAGALTKLAGGFSMLFNKSGQILPAAMFEGIDNLDIFGKKLSRLNEGFYYYGGNMRQLNKEMEKVAKQGARVFGTDYDDAVRKRMRRRRLFDDDPEKSGFFRRAMSPFYKRVKDIAALEEFEKKNRSIISKINKGETGLNKVVNKAADALDRQTKSTKRKTKATTNIKDKIKDFNIVEKESKKVVDKASDAMGKNARNVKNLGDAANLTTARLRNLTAAQRGLINPLRANYGPLGASAAPAPVAGRLALTTGAASVAAQPVVSGYLASALAAMNGSATQAAGQAASAATKAAAPVAAKAAATTSTNAATQALKDSINSAIGGRKKLITKPVTKAYLQAMGSLGVGGAAVASKPVVSSGPVMSEMVALMRGGQEMDDATFIKQIRKKFKTFDDHLMRALFARAGRLDDFTAEVAAVGRSTPVRAINAAPRNVEKMLSAIRGGLFGVKEIEGSMVSGLGTIFKGSDLPAVLTTPDDRGNVRASTLGDKIIKGIAEVLGGSLVKTPDGGDFAQKVKLGRILAEAKADLANAPRVSTELLAPVFKEEFDREQDRRLGVSRRISEASKSVKELQKNPLGFATGDERERHRLLGKRLKVQQAILSQINKASMDASGDVGKAVQRRIAAVEEFRSETSRRAVSQKDFLDSDRDFSTKDERAKLRKINKNLAAARKTARKGSVPKSLTDAIVRRLTKERDDLLDIDRIMGRAKAERTRILDTPVKGLGSRRNVMQAIANTEAAMRSVESSSAARGTRIANLYERAFYDAGRVERLRETVDVTDPTRRRMRNLPALPVRGRGFNVFDVAPRLNPDLDESIMQRGVLQVIQGSSYFGAESEFGQRAPLMSLRRLALATEGNIDNLKKMMLETTKFDGIIEKKLNEARAVMSRAGMPAKQIKSMMTRIVSDLTANLAGFTGSASEFERLVQNSITRTTMGGTSMMAGGRSFDAIKNAVKASVASRITELIEDQEALIAKTDKEIAETIDKKEAASGDKERGPLRDKVRKTLVERRRREGEYLDGLRKRLSNIDDEFFDDAIRQVTSGEMSEDSRVRSAQRQSGKLIEKAADHTKRAMTNVDRVIMQELGGVRSDLRAAAAAVSSADNPVEAAATAAVGSLFDFSEEMAEEALQITAALEGAQIPVEAASEMAQAAVVAAGLEAAESVDDIGDLFADVSDAVKATTAQVEVVGEVVEAKVVSTGLAISAAFDSMGDTAESVSDAVKASAIEARVVGEVINGRIVRYGVENVAAMERVGDSVGEVADKVKFMGVAGEVAGEMVEAQTLESTNTFVLAFRVIKQAIQDSADGIRKMAAIVKAAQLANEKAVASATIQAAAAGGAGGGGGVGGRIAGAAGAAGRGAAGAAGFVGVGAVSGLQKILGLFKSLNSAVIGFGVFALKAFALFTVVLGPVVVAIGALVVAFRNLFKASQGSEQIRERFKKAFEGIKNLLMGLIKPVADAVNGFFGIDSTSQSAGESLQTFSSVLLAVAEYIGRMSDKLANSKGFKAFQIAAENAITQIINILLTMGKLFKDVVTGDMESAGDRLVEIFMRVGYFILGVLDDLEGAFVAFGKFLIDVNALAFKAVVRVGVEAFKALWNAIKNINWGSLAISIGKTLGNGIMAGLKGDAWWTPIGAAKATVGWIKDQVKDSITRIDENGEVSEAAAEAIGSAFENADYPFDATGFVDKELDFELNFSSGIDSLDNLIDSLVDTGKGAVESIVGTLMNAISNARNSLRTEFFERFGMDIEVPIRLVSDDTAAAIQETVGEITKGIANALDQGGEELADDIGNAVGDAMQDAFQKFADLVTDYLGEQIDKIKDQFKSALETQRDKALGFFDDQIAAIEALEDAEERLFKKQEQIEADRQRARDRALQQENYRRDRAIAIYEGRVDDARMLDLQQVKNDQDFAAESDRISRDRLRDEQKRQRDILKQILNEQKDAAKETFDEIIDQFVDYVENIGDLGTLNQEELEAQFLAIADQANLASSDMVDAFRGYYTELPSLIAEHTDPTVGFFGDSLDKLLVEAKDVFGIGRDDNDAATILGTTAVMLGDMGALMSAAALDSDFATALDKIPTSIEDAFTATGEDTILGTMQEGIDEIESIIEGFDAEGIMEQAFKDANEAMTREFQAMVDSSVSLTAALVEGLDPLLAKLIAIEAAANNAGNAVGDVTEESSTGGNTGGDSGDSTGGVIPQGIIGGYEQMAKAWARDYFGNDSGGVFNKPLADAIVSFKRKIYFDSSNDNILSAMNTVKESISQVPVKIAFDRFVREKHAGAFANGGMVPYGNGGMATYMAGGMAVPGFGSTGVPALLHGGEFVLNKAAVDRIGLSVKILEKLNKERFNGLPNDKFISPLPYFPDTNNIKFGVPRPDYNKGGGIVNSYNTTNTTNIYVDNFIGEDEWFRKMLKDYNINHKRIDDRRYGITDPIYTTYKGASF